MRLMKSAGRLKRCVLMCNTFDWHMGAVFPLWMFQGSLPIDLQQDGLWMYLGPKLYSE